MSARKFIRVLFLLATCHFISSSAFADGQYKPGDKLNVWLIDGIKIYAKPNASAKVIANIPYGQQVIIIAEAANTDKKTVPLQTLVSHKAYKLSGYWVKVSSAGKTGYVFDGYLSAMPCLKINPTGAEEVQVYLRRNFGEPKINKRSPKKDAVVITYFYSNGDTLTTEHYDGCFSDDIILKNISYREALLFTKAYTYQADAISEVKIKDKGNGVMQISAYACD